MRIAVKELLKDGQISLSYFKQLLAKYEIKNRILLDEIDLRNLSKKMDTKTYKTKLLIEKINDILAKV